MFRNWEFLIAEIWGHLLVAILLTVGMAWILWGARARGQNVEMTKLRGDIEQARNEIGVKEIELARSSEKQEQLKDRMSSFHSKMLESQALQRTAEDTSAASQSKLADTLAKYDAIKQELSATKEKLTAYETAILDRSNTAANIKDRLFALRAKVSKGSRKATTWAKSMTGNLFRKTD